RGSHLCEPGLGKGDGLGIDVEPGEGTPGELLVDPPEVRAGVAADVEHAARYPEGVANGGHDHVPAGSTVVVPVAGDPRFSPPPLPEPLGNRRWRIAPRDAPNGVKGPLGAGDERLQQAGRRGRVLSLARGGRNVASRADV